jgi:large conductance mechanosensitive channel
MSMLKEFKDFAMRGNVVDLAVGVIIGTAFGKIVTSAVSDIIMPLIGLVTGGIDFKGLKYQVGDAMVNYGLFIQTTVDFIIIALVIFMVIKLMNRAMPPKPVESNGRSDNQLLAEIVDLLKSKK